MVQEEIVRHEEQRNNGLVVRPALAERVGQAGEPPSLPLARGGTVRENEGMEGKPSHRLRLSVRSLLSIVTLGCVIATWVTILARDRANEASPLALDGYCPVTMVHSYEWQLGSPKLDAVYEGRMYLFAGQRERQLFLSQPQRYAPVEAGCDVVRLVDEKRSSIGFREHGMTYNDRVYLFDSEESLETFRANPAKYAPASGP